MRVQHPAAASGVTQTVDRPLESGAPRPTSCSWTVHTEAVEKPQVAYHPQPLGGRIAAIGRSIADCIAVMAAHSAAAGTYGPVAAGRRRVAAGAGCRARRSPAMSSRLEAGQPSRGRCVGARHDAAGSLSTWSRARATLRDPDGTATNARDEPADAVGDDAVHGLHLGAPGRDRRHPARGRARLRRPPPGRRHRLPRGPGHLQSRSSTSTCSAPS